MTTNCFVSVVTDTKYTLFLVFFCFFVNGQKQKKKEQKSFGEKEEEKLWH